MGAFFTNVQLFVRGREESEVRTAIERELRAIANDAGLVDANDEEPDREILIEIGDGLVSVYDEATEGQDERAMSALASRLARALAATAMTVTVHDSDVLVVSLVDENGARVDAYNSHPTFFGKIDPSEKKRVAGDPQKWKSILREGATTSDLARAWKEKKLFCEETLRKTLDLVGVPSDRGAIGYNYAADKKDAKYTRFSFRAKVRPAHEQKSEGAPQFSKMAYSPRVELSRGSAAQISASVKNAGGATTGMLLVVSGPAIEGEHVTFERCEIVVGPPRERRRFEMPIRLEIFEQKRVYVARFPDLEIPAGSAAVFNPLAGGTDPRKLVDAMYASNVHANLFVTGGKQGTAAMDVEFVPAKAPTGLAGHRIEIVVGEAVRRPLHAPSDVDAHLLRPLLARTTLFALLSFDASQKKAARFANDAIREFSVHFGTSGKFELAIFHAKPGARPSTGSAKATGFFESARFKKLEEQIASEALVSASRGDNFRDFTSVERSFGDGFTFGTRILPESARADPDLPTLGLWIDVRDRAEEKIAAARETLHAICDRAMTKSAGVQAIVGRWGWAPSSSNIEMTAYEIASGNHGQCTLRRSWLNAFLRGVPVGTLWLSNALFSRVNEDALRAANATIEKLDDRTTRITIARDEYLDAIERALAPILPTPEDWRSGVARMYGR